MRRELVHKSFPLSPADLNNIVYGACLFASGGGGPVSMASDFLQKIKRPVEFINTTELASGELALVLADMGSPDAAKAGKGFTAPVNVYLAMKELMAGQGKTISYLMPIELGAVNTLLPFFVASQLEEPIPVINADPGGRAVPELEMTLLDVAGEPICPAAVASDTQPDGSYLSQSFNGLTASELEDASRDVVVGYGGVGGLACYPLDGDQLNRNNPANEDKLIQGSIGLCWAIGRQILAYQPLEQLQRLLRSFDVDSYLFIDGKITSIENRTAGGFDVGKVVLTDSSQQELWVYYKNESLLAWDPQLKKPRAMGPDGICFILSEQDVYPSGTPVTNADITEGTAYKVLGLSAFSKLRNSTLEPMFLENIQQVLVAFPEDGISIDRYIPIQALNRHA